MFAGLLSLIRLGGAERATRSRNAKKPGQSREGTDRADVGVVTKRWSISERHV